MGRRAATGLKVREGGQGREESFWGNPLTDVRPQVSGLMKEKVLLLLAGATGVRLCDLHQVSAPLWAQELHLDPADRGLGGSTFPGSATS